mmetsp:Transcript_64286/g.103961  ORF Transcript_64286/g.103961 Transcript_64286/m.103961 type:complete len:269 (-) Transcript_64286:67-873(-)
MWPIILPRFKHLTRSDHLSTCFVSLHIRKQHRAKTFVKIRSRNDEAFAVLAVISGQNVLQGLNIALHILWLSFAWRIYRQPPVLIAPANFSVAVAFPPLGSAEDPPCFVRDTSCCFANASRVFVDNLLLGSPSLVLFNGSAKRLLPANFRYLHFGRRLLQLRSFLGLLLVGNWRQAGLGSKGQNLLRPVRAQIFQARLRDADGCQVQVAKYENGETCPDVVPDAVPALLYGRRSTTSPHAYGDGWQTSDLCRDIAEADNLSPHVGGWH